MNLHMLSNKRVWTWAVFGLSLWLLAPTQAKSTEEPTNTFELAQIADPELDDSIGTQYEDVSLSQAAPAGGMASSQVFLRSAALNIYDVVSGYAPPIGPRVDFRLNYNYLEAIDSSTKGNFANFGPGWTLNWVSFLKLDQKGNATVLVPGGGSEYYPINNEKGQTPYKPNLVSHAQLVAQPEGEYERRLPDGSVEIYGAQDTTGRLFLTQFKDRSGNALQIGYDKWFRTESITDAVGQKSKIRFASDTPGTAGFYKVSEIEDPFGRSAKFTYDKAFARLESSTDPINLTSRFTYAPNSNLITQLATPYGTTKFSQYKPVNSPAGSLGLKTTHPDGTSTVTEHWTGDRHATYQWNKLALELYPTDPEKGVYSHCRVTKWMTRPSGKELSVKASVKEPLESEVVYSYVGQTVKGFMGNTNKPSSISRRVTVKNGDGTIGSAIQTYAFQYNDMGHVIRSVDPVGRTFSNVYASNGIDLLETRQTRAGNNVLLSKIEYDNWHRPIVVTNRSGNKTRYQYDERGLLVKQIDAANNEWEIAYDKSGYPSLLKGPGGGDSVLAKFSYDRIGRISSSTDSNGHTFQMKYDNADRLIEKTFEDGTSERFTYDKLDAVAYQDRAGRVTKRTYDNQDRLTSITDPMGRKSQYEWCLCGALRKLTDPAGHSTEWHHDIAGRIIQKKFANGTETTFEYEKDGHRLALSTDALKQKTLYSYNLDDTLAEIAYQNAVNPTSTTKYQNDTDYPVVKSVSNGLGTISFEYHPIGRAGAGLPSTISNSIIPNSTISLEYDASSNVVRRSINGEANAISSKYDAIGRIISENTALGEFNYSYGDDTRKLSNCLSKISYPNGIVTKFNYEGQSGEERLQSIINSANNVISQFDYGYDKSGQIVKWQEGFAGKSTAQFALSYDDAGQLTDAVNQIGDNSQIYHYQYDLASNRILSKTRSTVRECAYNSMNELISLATKAAESQPTAAEEVVENLKYDANGNLLSDGEKSYRWDANNRLIRIDYSKTGKATEFAYDALGQRSRITELGADGKPVKQSFLVWWQGGVCEERNEKGEVLKKLFKLGENIDGKNFFFGRDHLGSTRQTLDGSGTVISRLDYDPFGQPFLREGSHVPDLQYAGYFTHAPSGLNLTLNRAYNSKLGRWLSRDPIGEFGLAGKPDNIPLKLGNEIFSSNLYSYVGNNSVQAVDRLGLQSVFESNSGGQYQSNINGTQEGIQPAVQQDIRVPNQLMDPASWAGNWFGLTGREPPKQQVQDINQGNTTYFNNVAGFPPGTPVTDPTTGQQFVVGADGNSLVSAQTNQDQTPLWRKQICKPKH